MKTGEVWSAPVGESFLVCPVPDCKHIAPIITKVHCRMHHNMEREEIEKKYGGPRIVKMNGGFTNVDH